MDAQKTSDTSRSPSSLSLSDISEQQGWRKFSPKPKQRSGGTHGKSALLRPLWLLPVRSTSGGEDAITRHFSFVDAGDGLKAPKAGWEELVNGLGRLDVSAAKPPQPPSDSPSSRLFDTVASMLPPTARLRSNRRADCTSVVVHETKMCEGDGCKVVTRRSARGHCDVRVVYSREFMLSQSDSPVALIPPAQMAAIVANIPEVIPKLPKRFRESHFRNWRPTSTPDCSPRTCTKKGSKK